MIEEAIKTITKIRLGETVTGGEYMRALKLGIEALERLQRIRPMPLTERPIWYITELVKPLPSEGEKSVSS